MDVNMTEVRAQFRQMLLDVDTGAIPAEQRLNSESMPKVI